MGRKATCPCGTIVYDRFYCSPEHREQYGKPLGRKTTLEPRCPCGNTLEKDEKSRYLSKFCSTECKVQYSKKIPGKPKNPDNFEIRVCQNPECGKEWEWRIGLGKGKYCSTKCANKTIQSDPQWHLKISESSKNRPRKPHSEETKAKLSAITKQMHKDGRFAYDLDSFPCGHPRTPENSRKNGRGVRCEICKSNTNTQQRRDAGQAEYGSEEHWNKLFGPEGVIKPSQIELDAAFIFEPLGYYHNGAGPFWVPSGDGTKSAKCPDYKKHGEKRVIEVFGTYWHRDRVLPEGQKHETPEETIDWYKTAGYECKVYWTDEIESMLEEIIPNTPSNFMVDEIEATLACELNNKWHSSLPELHWSNVVRNRHSACYGANYLDRYMAVGIWSSPTSPRLDDGKTLELRRLAIASICPKNTASWLIARMIENIKTKFPEIKKLISYQDTETHSGTLYEASGWAVGSAKAGTGGHKIRWEKSLP